MLRSYIVAAVLATAYMVAVIVATVGLSTSAKAGMSQDLASCTAAEGRSSAAACTRVMNSGRLPDEQLWIGHFNRGSGYRRAGDFEKALDDFEKAVELNPRFARAYQARGLMHDELGSQDKALADLARAIEIDPRDWSAYYSRATLLRGRQDLEGALADLAKAGDREPKEQVRLLRALIESDKGNYAAAREEINKVISDGGNSAPGYYARAAVAFQEHRLEAASSDLDRALALRESFAAARALQGRILEERGDKIAAKARYQKALDLPADFFEGRAARKMARERLRGLTGVAGVDRPDVALVEPSRSVGCKRFLPATGTIINAECDE